MHKYTKILFGLAGACLLLVGLFYMLRRFGGAAETVQTATDVFVTGRTPEEALAPPDAGAPENTLPPARICVYVCGAVENPGIYYLEEGARVAQALESAGGMLPDADLSAINPALRASDSQKIYVPTVAESAAPDVGSGASAGISGGLININTADAALLSTLPGIGKVKAESIVAYREENGGFKAVEDIKNVSGIKDSAYDKIKELICI